ncbi:MAG TPA: hypothetical protein VKI62_07730, partial [Bacteroidota bacterium]|nr:hypothetical protein [Bacteroidota bacterium]
MPRMPKIKSYILPVMFLLILSAGIPSLLFSQAMWRLPLTFIDSGTTVQPSVIAYFGVHPNATNCIDDTMCGFTDHWVDNDSLVYGLPYTPCMYEVSGPVFPIEGVGLGLESLSPKSCTDLLEANIHKYVS